MAKKPVDPRDNLIDDILKNEAFHVGSQADLTEQIRYLASRLLQKAVDTEMDQHLGYPRKSPKPETGDNERNGSRPRRVSSELGELKIDLPRDRNGTYEPVILPKYQRRLDGINEQILALYSRGLSTREIRDFFDEMYGVSVSAELVSRVTDAAVEEIEAWQNAPLDAMYPVVYFDAIRIKIRNEDRIVHPKAVHIALGIDAEGRKKILGLWIGENESAKFWLSVFNELKNRGVQDILIAVTDGLSGMPEALQAAFPQTMHQTCIVHLIRNSLTWVGYDDRPKLVKALKTIYQASSAAEAENALNIFEESALGKRFPEIVRQWRSAWERVIPFFDFSPRIRKMIYTTNAIEGLNRQIRKGIKTRGVFPTDESALKLVWLILQNVVKKWGPIFGWHPIAAELSIVFGERFSRFSV